MDKRKNNGGHSTKARSENDKRRSKGKQLLNKYLNEDYDYNKFAELMNKLQERAIQKGDVRAASLFLSYVLGKPKDMSMEKFAEGFTNMISLGSGKKDS